jgi:hypothetical protein|tara:strand:- start:153 stop:350 length:198 start_codon:yes stop_codon:yes gene_type:complete
MVITPYSNNKIISPRSKYSAFFKEHKNHLRTELELINAMKKDDSMRLLEFVDRKSLAINERLKKI